jgi:putative hydroxymethylpyrimidine transport system permease protein
MRSEADGKLLWRFLMRLIVTLFGLLCIWQLVVLITQVPRYILPSPLDVSNALIQHGSLLTGHALTTAVEIIAGMVLGCSLGLLCSILLNYSTNARRWLMPLMVISQALPVFAIAPLLTLWFGYGVASKIVMATLITFFPVAVACYDGLRYIDKETLDLVRTMQARPLAVLWQVQLPAALPAFASGLRVAASVAPIGAVVGEWVGSSHGLGYLMLHANGRMQTDLMFAALFVLCLMALAIYFCTHLVLNKAIYWRRLPFDT